MTNEERSDIGKRIRQLRINAELGPSEFAKGVGLTIQTLHHYENGQNYPATPSLISISKFCGVSIHWIISGTEFEPPFDDNKTLARSGALHSLDRIPVYFVRWVGWDIEKTTKKVSTPTLLKMERHFKSALKLLREELKTPNNKGD